MALSKIRLANKKAARELRRKAVRDIAAHKRANAKVRQKRTRKMMIQGRKDYLAKRRFDADYINKLETEINEEA